MKKNKINTLLDEISKDLSKISASEELDINNVIEYDKPVKKNSSKIIIKNNQNISINKTEKIEGED